MASLPDEAHETFTDPLFIYIDPLQDTSTSLILDLVEVSLIYLCFYEVFGKKWPCINIRLG